MFQLEAAWQSMPSRVGGGARGRRGCLRLYLAMPRSCTVGHGLVQHCWLPVEVTHGGSQGCAAAVHITMGAPDLWRTQKCRVGSVSTDMAQPLSLRRRSRTLFHVPRVPIADPVWPPTLSPVSGVSACAGGHSTACHGSQCLGVMPSYGFPSAVPAAWDR